MFDQYNENFAIKVRWIYDVDNDNAQEAGEDFIEDFPAISIQMMVLP